MNALFTFHAIVLNPATPTEAPEKTKKPPKKSGGLNDNEGVIKNFAGNSSKEIEKDKSSKDTPVKENEKGKKADTGGQQDTKKSKAGEKKAAPRPKSPDWKGFTALNSPLPPWRILQ